LATATLLEERQKAPRPPIDGVPERRETAGGGISIKVLSGVSTLKETADSRETLAVGVGDAFAGVQGTEVVEQRRTERGFRTRVIRLPCIARALRGTAPNRLDAQHQEQSAPSHVPVIVRAHTSVD